ncbi:MAG: hypothetical protein LIQ30_12195 [Planctomycetes bacterium]|nr:hypothetical protein [Planctomycetota bacterium]
MTEAVPIQTPDSRWKRTGLAVTASVVAGGGFSLSFGWVWYPALFVPLASCHPEVFSGTLLSGNGITAFSIGLLVGFVVLGILAGKPLPGRHGAVLLHGGAILLGGATIPLGTSFPIASGFLWGLSAAGPGVWWGGQMLRLQAPYTVMAMAAAALFAWVCASLKAGPTGVGWIIGGMVSALVLALVVEKREAPADASSPVGEPVRPTPEADARDTVLVVVRCGFSFYTFGVLGAMFDLPVPADVLAGAVGVVISLVFLPVWRSTPLQATNLAVAVSVAAVLAVLVFPTMTRAVAVLGGVMEGSAVAGLAASARRSETAIPSRVAFGLAGIFLAVNVGGALGACLLLAGDLGVWLSVVIAVGFAVPLYCEYGKRLAGFRRKAAGPAADRGGRREGSGQ